MVALLYLKHAFNLSDEELCERWSENVVWQFFSGMDYYEPRLPCDATRMAASGESVEAIPVWRQRHDPQGDGLHRAG